VTLFEYLPLTMDILLLLLLEMTLKSVMTEVSTSPFPSLKVTLRAMESLTDIMFLSTCAVTLKEKAVAGINITTRKKILSNVNFLLSGVHVQYSLLQGIFLYPLPVFSHRLPGVDRHHGTSRFIFQAIENALIPLVSGIN